MPDLLAITASASPHLHVYVSASFDNLPIWLNLNGFLIAGLFTVQAVSGYRRFKLTRSQSLSLHSTVAWMIVIAAGIHAILATIHLVVG